MIFIILYVFSLPVILYYNFFAIRNVTEKSRIARMPSFFLIYIAFSYGSILGLWFSYNWKIALLAFIISWTINKISFRLFLRQYIDQTTQLLISSDWFEPGLVPDDRLRKANEYAETTALNNAAGKSS